jgi:hypothetical protein
MQIQKRQKLLLIVTAILVIITFLSTFIITGCGRRAKIIAAKEKAGQTEEQNGQSQTETVKESGNSDTEETVKGIVETGESVKEEESTSAEKSGENEDNNANTEVNIENDETTAIENAQETIEDEETTASESAEETTAEEKTEYTADMPYVRAECANILGGESLYDYTGIVPGDTGFDNLEIRSFMSYDISQLLGAAVESAKISGTAESLLGTPVSTYGPMIIKSVYWGARTISPSEFDLNGTEITSISKTNFTKSPEALKDSLQSAINHAQKRYQLCFYFKMSQTDGDGESDYIYYPFPNIVLTVTYSK